MNKFLFAGLLLLCTTPVTLAAMQELLPHDRATGAGLAITAEYTVSALATILVGLIAGAVNGVLIAPYADLTINGGGNNTMDFVGCAMVNSAVLNGHVHFHYDECLANYKNNPRDLVTAWNEVK